MIYKDHFRTKILQLHSPKTSISPENWWLNPWNFGKKPIFRTLPHHFCYPFLYIFKPHQFSGNSPFQSSISVLALLMGTSRTVVGPMKYSYKLYKIMYMFNLQHNIHTFFNHVHHVRSAKQPNTAPYKNAITPMTYLQYPPLSHTNPSHLCIQQPPLPESPCILPLQIPNTCDQSLERWPKRSTLPRRAPPWSTDDAGPAWWDHSDIKQGSILRIYNSCIIIKKKRFGFNSMCLFCMLFGGENSIYLTLTTYFWLIENNQLWQSK